MKRIITAVTLLLTIAAANPVSAQAWDKGAKVLTLGLGGSNFWHINTYNDYWYRGTFVRTTGQIHFQGDFGIHKYVGLGFTTGFGGSPINPAEVNFSAGINANFHFYQLIADKVSRDIHADKLDIYAGLSVGSGVGVLFWRNTDLDHAYPLVFAGPHVGVRYYWSDHVGVYGEFGYGKSWISGGFAFRL